MANIAVPSSMIFPPPKNKEEADLFMALEEHLTRIRQTLIEIVEELP